MLRSNLCDHGDSYILLKGTITITGEGADAAAEQADERDKGVTFKNCAPFTKCISRINNTDIDNAHDIAKADSGLFKLVGMTNVFFNNQ